MSDSKAPNARSGLIRRLRRQAVFLPAAIGAGLTLLPVAYVVIRAFGASSFAWDRLLSARTAELLLNSVGLALSVALLAIAIALPYAWLVTSTDMPGRRFFSVVGPLPLVVPSYVGALIFVEAFGPRGLTQDMLEPLGIDRLPEIYGFFGALVTLTLFTYPYVLLLTIAAFKRVDPAMAETARGLGYGPTQAFFRATVPQLRPALISGGLLCALYSLSDFGVVSIMRFDTFTRSIYTAYRSFFDPNGAALLALVLIILTGLILLMEYRLRGDPRRLALRAAGSARASTTALGRWRWVWATFCGTIFVAAIGVPIAVLGYWLSVGSDESAARSSLLEAIIGSVTASGYAAILATLLAVPLAYAAVRKPGRAARVLEGIATSGFALPGVVVALGLVFFATRFADPIYQTLFLLVIAYVIRFLPQAVEGARGGLVRADPALEEAARGLGLSKRQAFRRVTLPLAAPGVIAGSMLVFLTAMKELPATLILKPTGFETLATRIWDASRTASHAEAAVPALVLIAVSAIALYAGSSAGADSGRPTQHD